MKHENLLIHKREYIKLPRNKTLQYLKQHNFSVNEKNALKKYRRNHQNKLCSKNYRNGFKEKIDMLEKKIAQLYSQMNLCLKENTFLKSQSQNQLHWKKRMLKNC